MDQKKERRRDVRILLKVPLVIEGTDIDGMPFREETVTDNVSIHGACIRTRHRVAKGSRLKISAVNFPFKSTALVHLVWVDEVDGVLKMGIEFQDVGKNWILK